MRAAACVLTLLCLTLSTHASDVAPPSPRPTPLFSNLPLLFVENRDQLDEAVRFSVPGAGRTLYFTREGITVALEGDGRRWALKLDFVEAKPDVVLRGEETQEAVFSYFQGNDPEKWQAGCPTYARIVYEDLWPGIDLVYRGEVGRLKHEFVVAPGSDPQRIRFEVRGATAVRLDAEGDFVLETPLGSFEDARPIAYQERDGVHVEVPAAFALDGTRLAFTLGAFDPTLPLVLDPDTILYSGFLGGSGDDEGFGIAVDLSGAACVTGWTNSTDFPATPGSVDPTANGEYDAFVAKVDPAGSGLVFCSFLGGEGWDRGEDIAVDASGASYVTGRTGSSDFPTVGPLGPSYNGYDFDAFVAKIDPTGTVLVYSGFLGGSGSDEGRGIAVDASGKAYVTGRTGSPDFPTAGTLGPTYQGGAWDAFLVKINAAGSAMLTSGFLGGSRSDFGNGVAVDATGSAYLSGSTGSSDFPTVGPLDPDFNGADWDAFVAKVDAAGSALVYSGFLGGENLDFGEDIAVDSSGAAHVTGRTRSPDFPTAGGLDSSWNGGIFDAFVTKVDAAGSALVYSGFLGGSSWDQADGIAIDSWGAAYVTGTTQSTDFPTLGGLDPSHNGSWDAFVAKVRPSGGVLLAFSGFLGHTGDEWTRDIAVDADGAAYVTGNTTSFGYPTVGGLGPLYRGGSHDAVVTKILVSESFLCRQGTVLDPAESQPAIVLRVNGSEGDEAGVVQVATAASIVVTMDPPPAGPIPAPFAMYGWLGEPSPSTVTPHPMDLGVMCFPTPVTGGLPQPKRIWNNIGHPEILGTPHYPSDPAPSTPLSKPGGIWFVVTVTFQGIILDDGSTARKPASITNAVILKVIP